LLLLVGAICAAEKPPEGWTAEAPRPEIRPSFAYDPEGGHDRRGAFRIASDGREGLDGWWQKEFAVTGGRHYRFKAYWRGDNLDWPDQSSLVRILWRDEKGQRVLDDRPLVEGYLNGFTAWTPGEFPGPNGRTESGWTEAGAIYQAPAGARRAQVQLHLQWAPHGRIAWSGVEFAESDPPAPRKVRLAAIHYQPRAGETPEEKRRQYAPLIARAAERKADLVVLGETLTYYGTKLTPADAAEPIPGPSTRFFAELARKHNLYIVAGLYEREAHLVYNVAVLLSPDGELAGKYRKVTLPDGEVQNGVAPGRDYPVFDTRFGKVGMMVCYDGFFPEVARELTRRGAEIIAWPVWGFHPQLGAARSFENHVFLVSSTYEDVSRNWGTSSVWNRAGLPLVQAKDWGSVVVAEVDMSDITRWRSLGDFRAKLPRHVPMIPPSRRFE
jgi:predicted amidohydrolase